MIGRGAGNHLQLADLKASRQHARLRFAQGMWFIQDQNSSGGTFVNGQRIQATRLNPGDQITIGDTAFIFRL
jgi:pSer/pThr/pTyr-binding forkhead associated (FHA) protein